MPATATLTTYKMYIDGQWVDGSSGNYFESDDPFRAEPWALIPRGTAADVDRAVRAAHKAFTSGEWPKLTASRRGALLRRLGDLITERVEATGRDRSSRQRQAVRRDEHADGVHGAVVSLLRRPGRQDRRRGAADRQARHLQLHALRAARRHRRDRPVELAAAADDVEAGAGAGCRQHGRHQAVGVHVGIGARVHEADRGGGLPARRRQRRHRVRRRCRRAAGRASARGQGRVHRLRRDRPADLRSRRARDEARHDGARRQVAEHRVRRCRARQRGEGRRSRASSRRRDRRASPGSRLLVQQSDSRSVPREARGVREDGEDGRTR